MTIKKFTDFDKPKKYGYVKAELEIPNWNKVLEIIDPEDLVLDSGDGGYAKNPHVTILYGFHENVDQDDMKQTLEDEAANFISTEVKIGKISLFENSEFDVVKMEVDSDECFLLNDMLSKFPHDKLHDGYNPHLTIAYVKKGCGKKYLNANTGAPDTASVSKLVYTGSNRNVKISVEI